MIPKRTLIPWLVALSIIGVITAIVIPVPPPSHSYRNESSAIGSLMLIAEAQARYLERSTDHRYGNLRQLGDAGLIDRVLASGSKAYYRFSLSPSLDPATPQAYTVTAEPLDPKRNKRYFFADQSGIIRFSDSPARADSSPLDLKKR